MRYLLAAFLVCSAWGQSGYHQTKKWTIGGAGNWGYLVEDAQNHRLYVTHGAEVDVVDTISGQVAGKVAGFKEARSVALAPEFNHGFITDGPAATVTAFDMKSLMKVMDGIVVGKGPDVAVYDPASQSVLVLNRGSDNVTVLDGSLAAPVGSFDLEGHEEAAAANGEFAVFINISSKNRVARVDARKLLVEQNWPTAPCEAPTSIALDNVTRRIFVGCTNKMMAVLDMDGGQVVGTTPICEGVGATAFDPGTKLIFHACSDGNLTIVREDSPDTFTVTQTVPTQTGSKQLALNPMTHEIYVPASMAPDTFGILVYGPQ